MLCFSTFGRVRGNSESGMAEMRLGLQKLTLLDYPGKVACTVFTCGCDFRCPFCHNASLVTGSDDVLEEESEILAFLRKRTGILDGVCITGGEPLMHEELFGFARQVKELGFSLKLDTNGSYPDRLERMLSEGLADYVAMDIKNAPAKYAMTVGGGDFLPQVRRSVELLKEGRVPYEFRTTVTGNLHDVADFAAIGEWIRGAEKYFLQPFLASGDILAPDADYSVSAERVTEFLNAVRPFVPAAAVRGK